MQKRMKKITDQMIQKNSVDVAEAMIKYGGSFCHYLGEAMLRADYHNLMKIIKTWPNYMRAYYKMWRGDNGWRNEAKVVEQSEPIIINRPLKPDADGVQG